jgi:hypothetical protein
MAEAADHFSALLSLGKGITYNRIPQVALLRLAFGLFLAYWFPYKDRLR